MNQLSSSSSHVELGDLSQRPGINQLKHGVLGIHGADARDGPAADVIIQIRAYAVCLEYEMIPLCLPSGFVEDAKEWPPPRCIFQL